MTNRTRFLAITAIIGLILASCSLTNSSEATDASLLAAQATATLSLPEQVNIEFTGQADTSVAFTTVGQVIKFSYAIKMLRNDSVNIPPNVTITGAAAGCQAINTVGNLDERLDAGEIITCTYDYPIAQTDLDRGSVSITATANVYTVNSNPVTTTVATVPPKALTLTKAVDPATYALVGQVLKYTYVVKNSGSQSLGPAQFTVTDAGVGTPINCGEATLTLASNATVTCSANHTVTQADIDAGSIATSATASGGGAGPSQPATATATKGELATGSTIQHTVAEGEWLWQIARCYGADPVKVVQANTQLSNPALIKKGTVVTVPNIGSVGKIYAPQPCIGKHLVATGDTWSSIAAKYGADATILQMVNGNTLTVGKEIKVPFYTAGLTPPTATPTSTPAAALLTLTTSAAPGNYNQVGQVITFTYVIKNSGAATLGPAQFTVTDTLISATAFNCGDAALTLAPGATATCSANYTITEANLGVASILNNAVVAGGGAPTSQPASTTVIKQ